MKLLTAGQTKLGFIGVGAMGSRLVRRLRDHGYDVGVYDRNQEAAEALRQYGASVASSPAMVAQSADVILSCLTNDDAVRSAYLEADGVLSVARQGQVVIEMSTVSPKTSREVHAAG
ncbi:MAG: NAD(P)-binding domain-containing protein, partial [Candidatus Korobacteraceae bacterium]